MTSMPHPFAPVTPVSQPGASPPLLHTLEAEDPRSSLESSSSFVSKKMQLAESGQAAHRPGGKSISRAVGGDNRDTQSSGRTSRRGKLQTSKKPKIKEEKLYVWVSAKIVDNKYFILFTTIFTFYALIGDDIKLMTTNKPADLIFNYITIMCLVLFSFEIVLSCIGKRDYFLGFFFTLDVVSTATLVLDISFVAEVLYGGNSEDLDMLRSGRTARVGAKAGRIVRVIRLVRILKLYKALYEARVQQQAEKKAREKKLGLEGKQVEEEKDDEDWGDEEDDDRAKSEKEKRMASVQESRVGKKLSEMTTRRVIILVLTMLLVMPFLQMDNSAYPPAAAYFAADNVLDLYMLYNSTRTDVSRLRYEKAVLKYMYYHNWYCGNMPDEYCSSLSIGPVSSQSHSFWLGIMSLAPDARSLIDDEGAWASLQVRTSSFSAFKTEALKSNNIYPVGKMPAFAEAWLAGKWSTQCHNPEQSVWRRGISILEEEVDDHIGYAVKCPEDLRNFEKMKYYPRSSSIAQFEKWHFAFYFDMRPEQQQEASSGLQVTAFICVVLTVASLRFSSDANRLVLRPVEKMIKRVEIIRENPLMAVHMADEEFKTELQEQAKQKAKHLQAHAALSEAVNTILSCGNKNTTEPMETVILEKTIIKLGSLLALGFGEAGANIINHNLQASDSAGVNGMVPGSRVEAIIGVARVRDFSTATEVLSQNIMAFVNQIAEIVHGVVSEFHGSANKNNGDTFLLVWQITGLEDWMTCRMADMATIAFAKILGAIHASPTLAMYRKHPGMQQRLGSNYRVCLSFGLHAGWAIEGAVGSEFKIDASYLSPNVSIAVNIEEVTSLFGVSILMTESVVDLCCLSMAMKFRKIDRVIISGSSDPLDIFCLDLDYTNQPVDPITFEGRPTVWTQRLRFKARQFFEVEKAQKIEYEFDSVTIFNECEAISMMRWSYSMEFVQLFNMGYANYYEGEWEVARKFLTKAMLQGQDGPSAALLRFMEFGSSPIQEAPHLRGAPYRFVPPPNWKGVHDLNHKQVHWHHAGHPEEEIPTDEEEEATQDEQVDCVNDVKENGFAWGTSVATERLESIEFATEEQMTSELL